MSVSSFSAMELFDWLCDPAKIDFLLLDVRNDVEFGRFKVEGPFAFEMVNVPYMEFIEHEEESVARVPKRDKIRIVCAKEGSSRFVGEILVNHGFRTWPTCWWASRPGATCWRRSRWPRPAPRASTSSGARAKLPAATG